MYKRQGSGSTSGDIRGFQNVAFPIVRRVFGGLVANELVSIQPMSLPSGLLFYLDYTYGTMQGGNDVAGDGVNESALYVTGSSIYNNPTGKGIQSGSLGTGGQYDLLGSGYSRRHDTKNVAAEQENSVPEYGVQMIKVNENTGAVTHIAADASARGHATLAGAVGRLVDFDAQLAQWLADNTSYTLNFAVVPVSTLQAVSATQEQFTTSISTGLPCDLTMLQDIGLTAPSTVTAQRVTSGDANTPTGSTSYLLEIPAALQSGKGLFNLRRFT